MIRLFSFSDYCLHISYTRTVANHNKLISTTYKRHCCGCAKISILTSLLTHLKDLAMAPSKLPFAIFIDQKVAH